VTSLRFYHKSSDPSDCAKRKRCAWADDLKSLHLPLSSPGRPMRIFCTVVIGQMQRFKTPEQAQDFLFAHAFIYGHSIRAGTGWRPTPSCDPLGGVQGLAAEDVRPPCRVIVTP
jgi:hypothetical protein